jgi:predicted PurR-regulated permease PerM
VTAIAIAEPRSRLERLWGGLVAAWGGLMGLLPHVLHHVGPLAGAAILAGATGRVLFAAVGFVAAIPMLRRLHRRYATWKAPAIALAVFALMFVLSSFVIGPALSGSGSSSRPSVGSPGGGHASHHP